MNGLKLEIGGQYKLAPYKEITEEEFKERLSKFEPVNYDKLSEFESSDNTSGAKELACSGDKCDV